MIEDVLTETQRRLSEYAPQSATEVRALPQPLVAFSNNMTTKEKSLKSFLYSNMYRHPNLMDERENALQKVGALAHHFMNHPETMTRTPDNAILANKDLLARTVLDYLACMTDNYAQDTIEEFNL